MATKWARDYFAHIRKISEEEKVLQVQLEYGMPKHGTGGIHSAGTVSDPVLAEFEARQKAAERIERINIEQLEALCIINGLTSVFSSAADILIYYYLDCMSWSQVAAEVGMSKSGVYAKSQIMLDYADQAGKMRLLSMKSGDNA